MDKQQEVLYRIGGELEGLLDISIAIASRLPSSDRKEIVEKLTNPSVEPHREFSEFLHPSEESIKVFNSAARNYISRFVKNVS